MKLILFILFSVFSFYYTVTNAATITKTQPIKSKTAETRKAQQAVSKSLYAKLKAQALNEARAELALEQEARERAKLEALQELDAGAGDVTPSDSSAD